jgi:hypothetical protein
VPRAEGAAEERHALAVEVPLRAREGERGAPVLELAPGVDELARPAAARSEGPVIEQQHRHAARRELLGEVREPDVARPGEAVAHHDDRCTFRRGGPVEPRGALRPLARESHVPALAPARERQPLARRRRRHVRHHPAASEQRAHDQRQQSLPQSAHTPD